MSDKIIPNPEGIWERYLEVTEDYSRITPQGAIAFAFDALGPFMASAAPAQSALKLDLQAARDAVREEIGSRLCHLTPHGTRICSRQVSSTCLCEETARAALCSQAPVSEGVRGAPREMWAMLYLHDWDPPKEGQEHRWEPGKNVFPEIHNVYETMREVNAVLSRMSDPKKYWVRRVWMPAHDAALTAARDTEGKGETWDIRIFDRVQQLRAAGTESLTLDAVLGLIAFVRDGEGCATVSSTVQS